MEPARQNPERPTGTGPKRNAPRREWDNPEAGHGQKTRRVEEPPSLALLAAPVVGLLIWGGLIALIV